MEKNNIMNFKNNFITKIMYHSFIKKQGKYNSAKSFQDEFNDIMKVEQSTNKYNSEFKKKLEIELSKFSGKKSFQESTETAS